MSQPFDLSQFPDLPPEVAKAFAAIQFALSVERAARQHEQAVVAEKDAFITELKALIEKLEGQVQDYRRTKFGPKSEKLDPAQLGLALEDQETAIAETRWIASRVRSSAGSMLAAHSTIDGERSIVAIAATTAAARSRSDGSRRATARRSSIDPMTLVNRSGRPAR